MVDLSHANSGKDHMKQIDVGADVARQLSSKSSHICGVMIESNLVEGRQNAEAARELVYGQSVTDACLSIGQTAELLRVLARAAGMKS
jgi:3-deoxy-7-phosphoheptulonate synthase